MNNKGRVPLKEKNMEFSRFGLTHPPTPKSPEVWGDILLFSNDYQKIFNYFGKKYFSLYNLTCACTF